jgi:hypothetical protein
MLQALQDLGRKLHHHDGGWAGINRILNGIRQTLGASVVVSRSGSDLVSHARSHVRSVMISLPSLICLLLYLFASLKREETGFAPFALDLGLTSFLRSLARSLAFFLSFFLVFSILN